LSIPLGQDVIGEGLYEDELINFLRDNYKTSTTLSYNDGRDTMYLQIDRIDGQVKGVYTNYAVDLPATGVDPSTYLYENGINCEHVWPQSMYEGSCPMKCDLHHLRPSKSNVNQSRGNKPFGEILDYQTETWYWLDGSQSTIPISNIDEYSETKTGFFEPREDRKGDIARTTFYFYTMYSDVADEDFFMNQKEALKNWHIQDPVNEDEIDRTWKIAEYQENKPNPFILDDTLIERAYFFDGFIMGDMNGDGILNILDVVALVNIVLYGGESNPIGDMNSDDQYNILDVVILVGIILS